MPTKIDNPARLTQIADQIVDVLNEGEFSQDFEAKRYFSPRLALDELAADGLRVAVFKAGIRRTNLTRTSKQFEFDVNVSVLAKLNPEKDEDELGDECLALAEELAEVVENTPLARLTDGSRPIQTDTHIRASYSPEHFVQERVVLCDAVFSYRILG